MHAVPLKADEPAQVAVAEAAERLGRTLHAVRKRRERLAEK